MFAISVATKWSTPPNHRRWQIRECLLHATYTHPLGAEYQVIDHQSMYTYTHTLDTNVDRKYPEMRCVFVYNPNLCVTTSDHRPSTFACDIRKHTSSTSHHIIQQRVLLMSIWYYIGTHAHATICRISVHDKTYRIHAKFSARTLGTIPPSISLSLALRQRWYGIRFCGGSSIRTVNWSLLRITTGDRQSATNDWVCRRYLFMSQW